ncbi:MAG: hypothetical protein ACYDC2_06030 [Solirubrobacteraceae bacterium]
MGDERTPLRHLNRAERVLLGWLVRRLWATDNPRFERALEETGAQATARMACVNALRLYAIVLFVLGTVVKLAHAAPAGTALYVLAAASMAWSFWCLYTVLEPERAFRKAADVERRPI